MKSKIIFSIIAVFVLIMAVDDVKGQTVSVVSSSVKLTTKTDYVITGTIPFTALGSVDISHDDAVVIMPFVKPSKVLSDYLEHIYIYGDKATRDNVWVGIYNNGSIVYPHAKTKFNPLTVYTGTDYSGRNRRDFIPYIYYNNSTVLQGFEDNISSFKLKRGYMATLACNSDGTGYSRVFIAQDADLEVPELQKELRGRVGFIRVFPWNKVTKKGWAGYDWTENTLMNCTWNYGWDCNGGVNNDDFEYVAMHHHENWPTMDEVAGLANCNTVLGNNEPDNTGDPSQGPLPFEDMERVLFGTDGLTGNWHNIYKSGLRVGSPAMCGNPRDLYLSTFMDLCKKYNYRIDFITVHRYWVANGGDYDWDMNETYNKYRLPMWLTEWNYGAEWTSWPGANWDLTDENQRIERDGISSIVTALEANPHVERYSFFNHMISSCRHLVVWDERGAWKTLAGEWYANLKSNTSYTGGEGYQMTWTYYAPKDLSVTFDNRTKTALLSWTNLNGKQTDSTYIERRIGDEKTWHVIARRGISGVAYPIFRADTLTGISGLVTYRIRNFDSDGRSRTSGEVDISLSSSDGSDWLQYGKIILTDAETPKKVDFSEQMPSTPAVFMGPLSDNNVATNLSPLFTNGSITSSGFTYTPQAWLKQPKGTMTLSSNEEVPFMAIPIGNYEFTDVNIEVGTITLRDTVSVKFKRPFPEGTVPVVIGTVNRATHKGMPTLHKIWNVTNTGFDCTLMYERATGQVVALNQQLSYLAMAPGNVCVDDERGIYMAAGHGDRKVYSFAREEAFKVGGETLLIDNPVVFAEIQSDNVKLPTALRLTKINHDGIRVRRVIDLSGGESVAQVDKAATADEVGWICVYTDNEATSVEDVITKSSYNNIEVRLNDGVVTVDDYQDFNVFDLNGRKIAQSSYGKVYGLRTGIYIVHAGGGTAKIVIR